MDRLRTYVHTLITNPLTPLQSVEQEPKAVTKAAINARRGGSAKRNRTAQIHNLSEKVSQSRDMHICVCVC